MAVRSGNAALPPEWRSLSRRGFLGVVAAAAAGASGTLATGAAAAAQTSRVDPTVYRFRSRPDLAAPAVAVSSAAKLTSPGYVFTAAAAGPGLRGPMIVDDRGDLVWFRPLARRTAMNFRAQTLRGAPVLTWWEGGITGGYGAGEYVIADPSYRELYRVRAGNGFSGDLHEFLITDAATALMTVYTVVPADLSSVGGPVAGSLLESIVQEVDIGSGRVLLEWHALDHVDLAESFAAVGDEPFDHFHVNSVDVDHDGHLLISARNTWAVYKVDRQSGAVIWRLGGKRSNLALADGAQFFWQHDARRQPDGTVTLFDDGAAPAEEASSRGIRLEIDPRKSVARKVELEQQFVHPTNLLAVAMGSMQPLADGGAFVGWGTTGAFSEFAPDGSLRFDARFEGGGDSYRAYRTPWEGRPASSPSLAVEGGSGRKLTVYASWNGATDVTAWRLLAGPTRRSLRPVATVSRTGFETPIRHRLQPGYVAATALDRRHRPLASSPLHRLA